MAAMQKIAVLLLLLLLIGVVSALNPINALAGVQRILPKRVVSEIPSKLLEKISKFDEDDDSLTTSYTFPKEYKTTLYKDQAKKTTLVNVFPTVEVKTYSMEYFDPGYQVLETSTTLLYEALNSTVEYQPTPMLNSTLTHPITIPVQSIGYATPEYQHEIHVYPTRINITELTSTTLVNYTRVETVGNVIPFL